MVCMFHIVDPVILCVCMCVYGYISVFRSGWEIGGALLPNTCVGIN
jgi:hypothetical protein